MSSAVADKTRYDPNDLSSLNTYLERLEAEIATAVKERDRLRHELEAQLRPYNEAVIELQRAYNAAWQERYTLQQGKRSRFRSLQGTT